MFGSVMLDVAIGLILVYLILSLACTALRELFEAFLKNRASFLHEGILELLHDPALTKDLYEHPLVNSLYHGPYDTAKDSRKLPSYIPSRSFALAVLDMAARGRDTTSAGAAGLGAPVMSIATIRQNIALLGNSKVQRVILSAIDTSEGELDKVREAIETWFNSSMDRVSGWYKRRSQVILIFLGIAIAGIVNVDTMRLAVSFYKDPSQRQAAVAMAGSLVKEPAPGATTPATGNANPTPGSTAADVAGLWTKLDSLSLPIGWPDPGFGLMRIFGWLLTALAVSLGAPFWFDLLSKFMTVRSALKPKPKAAAGDQTSNGGSGVTIVSPTVAAPPLPAAAGGVAAPAPVAAGAATAPGVDYQPNEWSSGHAQEGVI